MTKLVIVESPAKAKTISQYLGDDFQVLASVGHIRDLIEPKAVAKELKKTSIGKYGVDIENDFKPVYEISAERKKLVSELKAALKDADELYLATDEDREGEAIAWHLQQILKPKVPTHRMVFHEITKDAIQHAKSNTRELNMDLIEAQETRRILDRIFGFSVSKVLWQKVGKGLSAGRVQSPTLRLIVERELERQAFISAGYWNLNATAKFGSGSFEARAVRIDEKRLAKGDDFDQQGKLTKDAVQLSDSEAAELALALKNADVAVTELKQKPYSKTPPRPFTTSTLQQEAGRKLRMSSRSAMGAAQYLYENGYITYMRTDSQALSEQAISAARSQALKLFGEDAVASAPRIYKSKAANAQEAHEAIRPTGDIFRTPEELQGKLTGDHWKLYDMIWRRTLASQMSDLTGLTTTVHLGAAVSVNGTERNVELNASGTVISNFGWRLAYQEGRDDDKESANDAQLPALKEGDRGTITEVEAKESHTQPPARYTEASIVQKMESLGIGRPSTYVATLNTLFDRGYVTKQGQALIPNWIAFPTIRLMEREYADYVDYEYTASLERDLDKISNGKEDGVAWLKRFYYGEGDDEGLLARIEEIHDIDVRELNSLKITDNINVRLNRSSEPFIEVFDETGERRIVNIPRDVTPDQLTPEKVQELVDAPPVERVLGKHPENGRDVWLRDGRYGLYVSVDAEEGEKPQTAGTLKGMTADDIDFETALHLLSLPKELGVVDEVPVIVANGPFGPYVKKGPQTASLPDGESPFEVNLDRAIEILNTPRTGRRTSANVRSFDEVDPVSEKKISVKVGRFGPYVTDGETNATIPAGDDPAEISFERAVELLAIRREKGPAKKRTRRTATKAKPKSSAKKK